MQKNPILVAVAMEVEARVLLEKLTNLEEKKKHNIIFYEGYLNEEKIIVLLTKVSLISASSALTIAILEYEPRLIINYGIAGAMSKDIHTKDIIIGTTISNINSYRTSTLEEGKGSNPNKWELLTFLSGETDRYIEYETNNKLLALTKEINYTNGNIIYGKIGSGDVWNREVDRILYLNEKYNIICEDMESIALYTIANNFNIPIITIKIISDNSLINEEYNRNVGEYLQDYIYKYLTLLINNK